MAPVALFDAKDRSMASNQSPLSLFSKCIKGGRYSQFSLQLRTPFPHPTLPQLLSFTTFCHFTMRSTIFTTLVLSAGIALAAPYGTFNTFTLGKGGNAVTGSSGSVNGGSVSNSGFGILNLPYASEFTLLLRFYVFHLLTHFIA